MGFQHSSSASQTRAAKENCSMFVLWAGDLQGQRYGSLFSTRPLQETQSEQEPLQTSLSDKTAGMVFFFAKSKREKDLRAVTGRNVCLSALSELLGWGEDDSLVQKQGRLYWLHSLIQQSPCWSYATLNTQKINNCVVCQRLCKSCGNGNQIILSYILVAAHLKDILKFLA